MSVDDHTAVLGSASAFYRRAPPPADRPDPLYLHGVPMSADIWTGLLEHAGGIAPDLPGFGRSDKGGQLDYSVPGLAGAAGALVDSLDGVDAIDVVGHGWGAVIALQLIADRPGLVRRAVLIEPLALTAGHTWSGAARALRTPLVGEIAIGAVTRWLLARMLRARAATPAAWPDARVRDVWDQLDQGTQRAILLLYRATAADHLDTLTLPDLPALILHGRDGAGDAERVARLLQGARVQAVPEAGHWPWLDGPDTAQTVGAFLGAA